MPSCHVVELILIHHSTDENWLRDEYDGLGQALANNNYFVSGTNYGWGPDGHGNNLPCLGSILLPLAVVARPRLSGTNKCSKIMPLKACSALTTFC